MSREYIVLSFLVAVLVMTCAWIFRKSFARIPHWRLLLTSLSFFALRAATFLSADLFGFEVLHFVGDLFLLTSIALVSVWIWNVFARSDP